MDWFFYYNIYPSQPRKIAEERLHYIYAVELIAHSRIDLCPHVTAECSSIIDAGISEWERKNHTSNLNSRLIKFDETLDLFEGGNTQ